ncbi:DUF551 domain-containing protein [Escherichia coli]|uniref:DUF551 domain-containing protein n=1 Tax=Escherichia coli TaxID=562 RepID=UPI000191E923|nr:DUF551 domain-containing protein [Escherichia coli LF82]CAH1189524.1 EaA [Escherichia phage Gally]CAP75453.1 hypothetical protein LF82_098 [Escherichia coli LF82]DAM59301.1 MAG TPA: Protein of unknown function (DUF551) [Caudoviricetes sp.]
MTTMTKERLLTIKQWRETYGPGSNVVLPAEEAEELARIALASLEAEPIGEVSEKRLGLVMDGTVDLGGKSTYRIIKGEKAMKLLPLGTKFYTAPPVPVVPEEKPMPNPLKMYAVDAVAAIAEVRGWNSCRAAMLQGSQPVSQTYKFPVNTPCQDAPAHIWLQTAGVWPEDGELSELTWCSHNQHHDDTLYVRADLVNGNYPVTPDGWISCSERMPDKLIPVMVMYEDGEMWSAMWNGNRWDDGTEYPDPHSVTHWREMPAAPQQEVK